VIVGALKMDGDAHYNHPPLQHIRISSQMFLTLSSVTLIAKVSWLAGKYARPGNLTLTL